MAGQDERGFAPALGAFGIALAIVGAVGLLGLSAIDLGLVKLGDAIEIGAVAYKSASIFLVFGLVLAVAASGARLGTSVAITALVVIGAVAVVPGIPKDAGGVVAEALKPKPKEYKYEKAIPIAIANGAGEARFSLSTESFQEFLKFTVDSDTLLSLNARDVERKFNVRFELFKRDPGGATPETELIRVSTRAVSGVTRRFESGDYVLRVFVSSVRSSGDGDFAPAAEPRVVASSAVVVAIADVGPAAPGAGPVRPLAPPYDRADETFDADRGSQWYSLDVSSLAAGDKCLAVEATPANEFDPAMDLYVFGADGALGEFIDGNDDYESNPMLILALPEDKRAVYQDEDNYGAFLFVTPDMVLNGATRLYLFLENIDLPDGPAPFRLSVRETSFADGRCAAPAMSADVPPPPTSPE